ncbi:uncharacterized protein LOC125673348 [Ostrea edulis]|uniref:uncharacterized protein LOC125673348 n=1 Tax=Ostrea edulis TaxID=37623 RepID=UPI0024AF6B2B|nr:uncharacterized protein LOC125673348 [Ostrea edulis]
MNESENGTVLSTDNRLTVDVGVTLFLMIAWFISCGVANELSKNVEEGEKRIPDTTLNTVLLILIFILNITTDAVMTWIYWMDDNIVNFRLSLLCIVVPTLANIVTMIFLVLNKDYGINKYIPIIASVVCSPLVQFFVLTRTLAFRPKHVTLEDWKLLALVLNIIETTFESVPQIIVQIYIDLKSTIDEEVSTKFFRYFTIATSVLGVLTSLYNVKNEEKQLKDSEIKFPGESLSYISSLAVIIPRVMILAVFVYAVGTYCAIVFIVHTVVTLGIAFYVGYKHKKSENEKDSFKIAFRNERKVWYFGGTISVGIVGFAVHLIDLFQTKCDQHDSSNQLGYGEELKPLPSS